MFIGTRVPLATLLDYLEAGPPLSEFLEDFPTVTRAQAVCIDQPRNGSGTALCGPAVVDRVTAGGVQWRAPSN